MLDAESMGRSSNSGVCVDLTFWWLCVGITSWRLPSKVIKQGDWWLIRLPSCNALCSVDSVWGFKWPSSTSLLDDGLQKDRNSSVPHITRNVGGNLFISWDNLICFYNVSPLQTFHTPKFQECRILPSKVEGAAMQEWQVWQIRETMMYWNLEEFKDRLHPKKLHLLSNHILWALKNLCTLWQCKWSTPYMP